MYGIIYRATGPGGKVYVGQTVKTLAKRKAGHKYRAKKQDRRGAFQIALLDEGFSNFTWEQIDRAETPEELDRKEKGWISRYRSNDPEHGYNTFEGGMGAKQTPESRRKLSEARKGKPNGREGKHHSLEARRRISLAKKGKSNGLEGKHHTEETRRKISEAQKKYYTEKKAREAAGV
jgi:group I intron endonuclease